MEQITTRQTIESREEANLRPYAMRSSLSRGREHPQEEGPWRTCFQRDRDRVIHCTAFRRLDNKTQVFVANTGDHFRTRLTHSLEVAQVSRSVARTLGLNEDLSETVALAHDMGHTPFGHSGGDVLGRLMQDHGGFEHNQQSLRIVTHLEIRYPIFRGLNLSYEVRESILKHNRPFVGEVFAPYAPEEGPLLEAQLVDLCDGIAYNSHDLDDGLTSQILDPNDLDKLEIMAAVNERVEKRWPGIAGKIKRIQCVSEVINYLLTDLIEQSARNIVKMGIKDLDDVRRQVDPVLGFSATVKRQDDELRAFLYENFYTHLRVHRMRDRSKIFIEGLFAELCRRPDLLPGGFQKDIDAEGLERTVSDYIAGMTDSYAETEYARIVGSLEGQE